MTSLRHFALALCIAAGLALGGCATATPYQVNHCEAGCTETVNTCTTECISQMGYGSQQTCEQNCARQRPACVAGCLRR